GTPIAVLTRDAAVVGEDVPYAGAISNLGAVIWCVAAVTSLLAAALLRRNGQAREWWLFLFAAGALSALLLADDLFLLHDEILPRYAEIPQKAVLLAYVVLTAAFAWHFRRQILATRFAPLLVGLVFFAASIVVDEMFETRDFDIIVIGEALQARNLVEDGFKLLGIVSWCGYLLVVSWRYLAASSPDRGRGDDRISPIH
ncbi:MAG: hypothetical protein ACR2OD_08990, partial [Gaiellaceae bacterium]